MPTSQPIHPTFADPERNAADRLIDGALAEDLDDAGDLTSRILIPQEQTATVRVLARKAGVLAGRPIAERVFARLDSNVSWTSHVQDGATLQPGTVVASVSGRLRSLLTGERTALNFLAHLSGVATLTRHYVQAVAGTGARIFDTRKTLPGYRLLDKYAVRCGGGSNHRKGLYDGILIKDNHLAARQAGRGESSPAEAVRHARAHAPSALPIEIEVDTWAQFESALQGAPDLVLLDNMDPATLRRAVRLRNETTPKVQLEASGGITLETVAEIAGTGVERISVGALTHSARALDLAFDWTADE